jgi:dTDP-4-amino-4,6-dideoxygalactose transaminase
MIPFSPPKIDQKVIDEVVEALRSGWITTGPKTKAFELKIADYTCTTDVLCVNSCTSGLFLMLKWFGIKEGDEVIVPAYTYSATANVILHCGAKPVMVDIKEDFTLDINDIKNKLNAKTKAIIAVDLGGMPCDYDELYEILKADKIKKEFIANNENQTKLQRPLLLADAAHSIGAVYKGKRVGSIADATVFSFHAVKNLTTAEGGAICFNLPKPFINNEIYNSLRIKSLHGQTKDALAKSKIGGWEYDIIEPGYKFNMPDVLAAIGLVEIDRYEETLLKRKEIFDIYTNKLSNNKWAIIPEYVNDSRTSSFHLYLLRISGFNEKKRNSLINKMSEKGIATNVHYKPLPMLSLYKGKGYNIESYPKSLLCYQQEITLPVYYDLTEKEALMVVNTLIEEVIRINA